MPKHLCSSISKPAPYLFRRIFLTQTCNQFQICSCKFTIMQSNFLLFVLQIWKLLLLSLPAPNFSAQIPVPTKAGASSRCCCLAAALAASLPAPYNQSGHTTPDSSCSAASVLTSDDPYRLVAAAYKPSHDAVAPSIRRSPENPTAVPRDVDAGRAFLPTAAPLSADSKSPVHVLPALLTTASPAVPAAAMSAAIIPLTCRRYALISL